MRTINEIRKGSSRARLLADPTRLSVALVVRDAALRVTVTQIAEEIGREKSIVSRHCSQLAAGNLIRRGEKVRWGYWVTPEGESLIDAVLQES